MPQPMSRAVPSAGGGEPPSPSTRSCRLFASGWPSHGDEAESVEGLEQQLPRGHGQTDRGRPKASALAQIDDHALAMLAARELQVRVHGVGRKIALGHLDELLVGSGLDAAHGSVDRDIAHRGFDAVDHQSEFPCASMSRCLREPAPVMHPRFTAGAVLVPDRHRQRSAFVARAHHSAAMCGSARNCSRSSLERAMLAKVAERRGVSAFGTMRALRRPGLFVGTSRAWWSHR